MPALRKYSWVDSFADAEDALNGRNSKKIGNNTYLKRRGDKIAVQLHNTDVVTFTQNGEYILDTGGYFSNTTKDRLNRYTPSYIDIYQRDYEWFVDVGEETRDFENGMRIE